MFSFSKKLKKPPKQIIAIGGKKFSGKDTVANFLMMEFTPEVWAHTSTSQLIVSRYCKVRTNAEQTVLTPEKVYTNKEKHREALKKVGEKWEAIEPAHWIKSALSHVEDYDRIILDSVRRESEYQYLKSLGVQFILVETDPDIREDRGCQNASDNHKTETEAIELLKKDPNTWVINNNGNREDLKEEVKRFVRAYTRNKAMLI